MKDVIDGDFSEEDGRNGLLMTSEPGLECIYEGDVALS